MGTIQATSTVDLNGLNTVLVCQGDLRIHTCHKVASSAMRVAVGQVTHHKGHPDDPHNQTTLMAVRHPLDRMVSMFSYFLHNENHRTYKFAPNLQRLGYRRGMPFEEFLPVFKEQYMNDLHTLPQVYFKGKRDIDILVPLEDLSEKWNRDIKPRWPAFRYMEKTHQSQRAPWDTYFTPETREEFETLLAEDLELYNHART